MEDIRASSPCDHALDGLELLHRLSLCDSIHYMSSDHDDFFGKTAADPPSVLPFSWDEEAEACDPSMYDPVLFSPVNSQPGSPSRAAFALSAGDRDKPLPQPPLAFRPSPPSTPRLTPASTPSSSPRVSISTSYSPSQPLPRSRPPSTNMSAPRSLHHHGAFPSISSTLSLLEERESESEKRSGVLVQSEDEDSLSAEGTVISHPPARKSSFEMLKAMDGETRRRPVLNLSMSTSSPQLRTLAELAHVPASPISMISTHSMAHKSSLVSLVPSVSSPLAQNSVLLPPIALEEDVVPSSSRWSMDSTDPDAGRHRPSVSAPATPPSPPKPKRSRLLSFISRGRAGSLGMRNDSVPPTPTLAEHTGLGLMSPTDTVMGPPSASVLSLALSSRRASRSGTYPPPLSLSTSTSTMSTASSASTLPTPADSQSDVTLDPFCPASPTFAPSSYLPGPAAEPDSFVDLEDSEPEKPTLPLPSPGEPTASFFLPEAPPKNFLSALARRRLRRRKKKLVITCLGEPQLPEGAVNAELAASRRERDLRRRQESIMHWCESFGPVRRFERKNDGSLHVHWRDWEVADMVCRVSAQVHIKGIGRVALAWYYVN